MLETYQHLPEHIDPIVISLGSFSIRWYSVMYLVGFAVVYLLLRYRIIKSEAKILSAKNLAELMFYLIAGLLIGARLGYVIFYDLNYFIHNPLEIFLPIQVTSYKLRVTGLSGMSYFGGLVGVVLAGLFFCKKRKINFWALADFVAPAVPAGYFFGRIGNFLNGELYGRPTEKFWGMYFPADHLGLLRHPSQLYEALFEGLVLFTVLWILRNGVKYRSKMLYVPCFMLYAAGYGFFRFFIEFFREPEKQAQLGLDYLTLGQIFSLLLIGISLVVYYLEKKNQVSCLKNRT